MKFNARPCTSLSDFSCIKSASSDFYANLVSINCSTDCPLECEFSSLTLTASSVNFPAPNYLPYLLLSNDAVTLQYFGMNGTALYSAVQKAAISLTTLANTMNNKLAYVKVYYKELSYTKIDQAPKMELTDLYSFFFYLRFEVFIIFI
jgi:hypothetical protein